MKIATSLVIVLLVAGLMAGMVGCGGVAANEIKIGVVGPMAYSYGENAWHGAQLVAEEINNAGGVKVGNDTYTVKLLQYDSNELLSVTDAVSAVERAINVDKVSFLTGGLRSEAVSAMQDVAVSNKVIFLGAGAGDIALCTKVTNDYSKYKYWFRVMPSSGQCLATDLLAFLDMVGQKIRSETGIMKPRVAILVEKNAFGDALAGAAQAAIPEMGLEVAGVWRPSANASDLTAELTAIEAAGAQIIFKVITGAATIPYAIKWGEMQVPAVSVGINGEAAYETFGNATAGKGNYETTTSYYVRGVNVTDKTASFVNKFIEEWGVLPGYAATTYDAIYILKQALERAGSLDPDAIVTALEKTDYVGTVGHIAFTQSHDVGCGFGNITNIGVQIQDGAMKGYWPPADGSWHGVKYEGMGDYVLPPWVIEKWKQ